MISLLDKIKNQNYYLNNFQFYNTKWASKIGPYTRKVIDNIFLTSIVKEQGYNPALSVLHLSDKYSKERLEISCQIALSKYPSPRYRYLNAILANNQDRQNLQENMKKEEKVTGHLRGPEFCYEMTIVKWKYHIL